ncbi:hypothetical protein SCUCBS95973_003238 [Sporothrix curviconia]|uniref:Uncharacterized protein n=1 Tax=Sporothrix curviconia TaxID=1260050 RepID=A0ABP0BDL6_9PEZI
MRPLFPDAVTGRSVYNTVRRSGCVIHDHACHELGCDVHADCNEHTEQHYYSCDDELCPSNLEHDCRYWCCDDILIYLLDRFRIDHWCSRCSSCKPTPSPGLTAGAKAGIGIGAAVGVVAVIAAIVAFVITRKHRRRDNRSPSRARLQISEPMPGAGRAYASDDRSRFEQSELEMKSRRYEDMVPRHVPRNMV